MIAYEFIESSNVSINKSGVIYSPEFIEGDDELIYNDKIISNEFIEWHS